MAYPDEVVPRTRGTPKLDDSRPWRERRERAGSGRVPVRRMNPKCCGCLGDGGENRPPDLRNVHDDADINLKPFETWCWARPDRNHFRHLHGQELSGQMARVLPGSAVDFSSAASTSGRPRTGASRRSGGNKTQICGDHRQPVGATALDGVEAGPVPNAFVAVTVKV